MNSSLNEWTRPVSASSVLGILPTWRLRPPLPSFPAPGISTEVTLSYMSEILAEADLALDEALSRLAAIASTGRRTNDDG
jgi:hypothetical protein